MDLDFWINPRVPHHEARAIADRLEVALFSYVGLLLAGDAKEATERIPEGGSRVSDLVSVVRDLS